MNVEQMMRFMQCVMRTPGGWAARARGCERYAHGETLWDALQQAIALLEDDDL